MEGGGGEEKQKRKLFIPSFVYILALEISTLAGKSHSFQNGMS